MPDVLCSLYSAMVQPVMEYGGEIWGVKQYHVMGKVLLKFYKEMLSLPPNASTIEVLGETGIYLSSVVENLLQSGYTMGLCYNRCHSIII